MKWISDRLHIKGKRIQWWRFTTMRLYFLIPLFAITFTVSLAATVTNRENFLNRVMRYVKIFNKQQTGQVLETYYNF